VEAQSGPVVLVGHSRAGIILSSVAEICPGKIARLVYVTAALVGDGESLRKVVVEDGTSLTLPNRVMAADGKSSMIKEEVLKAVFYGDPPMKTSPWQGFF